MGFSTATLVWLSAGLLVSATLAWLSRRFPNLFFEDDAYFYLQIAWNLGTGAGSTFDGLHQTNGYHLLWMWMLTPVAWLTASLGLGKVTFAAGAAAVGIAVSGLAAAGAFRSHAERTLAMLLFLFGGITMESTVLGALALSLARLYLGERPGRLGGRITPRARAALVAALIPLARIDYVWLAPALAWLACSDPSRRHSLPLFPVLVGTLAGAAVHVGAERLAFDSWISVSSAYKADGAAGGFVPHLLYNLSTRGNQLRYAVLAWLTVTTAYGLVRKRQPKDLAALAVVLLPVAVYSGASASRDWYFVAPSLMALVLASRAVGPSTAWIRATTAATAALVVAFGAYLALNADDMRRTRAFIDAANAVLTTSDIVYQVDGSGFTGYWLDARVVNGDGLVSSWGYRRRLLADDLGSYLGDIGATHVLTNRPPGPLLVSWHGLVLRREEATLLADTGVTNNARVRFRLFALAPAE
ncbi:MAG: hypothetical protein AB7Q29_04125 [Vicinamibacterales bacterium]